MINDRSRLAGLIAGTLASIGLSTNPTPLHAQTVSGTILGVVQDQQGAVIAKADVSARNLETGAVRKTVSDDNGAYRISSVPAGSYEVSSSASGFKTEVRSGVVVTVGGDVSVNFGLTVGAITEKVEVTGEASQLKAQFRVEMFNVLNNTNLQAQTMTAFDGSGNLIPTLGTPTSPTGNASPSSCFCRKISISVPVALARSPGP